MNPSDLRPGDVIRVPGYDSIRKPARLVIYDDREYGNLSDTKIGTAISLSYARKSFPRFSNNVDKKFGGTFWAIERQGKQIFPENKTSRGKSL